MILFNKKEINLPGRTSTHTHFVATRMQLNNSSKAYPISEAGLCLTQGTDLARLCVFIYSFLALRNFSHFLFISAEKKTWANKQWENKSWKGQRGKKPPHYGSKTIYYLSSSPSFLSQNAAALIPILVSPTTLYPSTTPAPWTYNLISPCLFYSFVAPTSITSPTLLLLSSLLFCPWSIISEPFSVLVLFHSPLLPWASMTFKNLEGRSSINRVTGGNEGKQEQGRAARLAPKGSWGQTRGHLVKWSTPGEVIAQDISPQKQSSHFPWGDPRSRAGSKKRGTGVQTACHSMTFQSCRKHWNHEITTANSYLPFSAVPLS